MAAQVNATLENLSKNLTATADVSAQVNAVLEACAAAATAEALAQASLTKTLDGVGFFAYGDNESYSPTAGGRSKQAIVQMGSMMNA